MNYIFVLLISLFAVLPISAQQVSGTVYIGDTPSQSKISFETIKINPVVKVSGDDVVSYTISYEINGTITERTRSGNSLISLLPVLSQIQKGKKIYFDHVKTKGGEKHYHGVFTIK